MFSEALWYLLTIGNKYLGRVWLPARPSVDFGPLQAVGVNVRTAPVGALCHLNT